MDDLYAINLAKTEVRAGYNTADPDRLLAVADEGLIDFLDHRQTSYSQCGDTGLKLTIDWHRENCDLFQQSSVAAPSPFLDVSWTREARG